MGSKCQSYTEKLFPVLATVTILTWEFLPLVCWNQYKFIFSLSHTELRSLRPSFLGANYQAQCPLASLFWSILSKENTSNWQLHGCQSKQCITFQGLICREHQYFLVIIVSIIGDFRTARGNFLECPMSYFLAFFSFKKICNVLLLTFSVYFSFIPNILFLLWKIIQKTNWNNLHYQS